MHCTVPRVYAAVVVTYSAPAEVLDRCLRSIVDAGGIDHIVLVDNGGRAVVADDLEDAVEVIVLDNPGYGAAANRGFAAVADADGIALLNDDVVVQPGWLRPLAERLAAPYVGAVQPMLVGADHSVVTSLGVQLDRFGAGSDIGDGEPVPADRSPSELHIFNGGAVVFDPRFLKVTGGFDESLFLYYEDVDLAVRGRRGGRWRYLLVPESVVEHRRGTSTSADTDGTRFHQERNRLWTVFRHGSPGTILRALGLSIRRLRHPPRSVHRRALLAGLAGAPRRLVRRVRAPGTRTARR